MMRKVRDKADSSGLPPITDDEARYIKGMIMRGDRNHDIAAFWGRNPARIAEIKQWKTFEHVRPITQGLPPPGPYLQAKEEWERGR